MSAILTAGWAAGWLARSGADLLVKYRVQEYCSNFLGRFSVGAYGILTCCLWSCRWATPMGGGLIHGMMHRLAGDTKSVTMIPRARKSLDSERLGMTNGAILSMLKSKAAMERPNSLMSGIIPIGSRGLRGALYFVLFAFVTSRQRVSSSGFALAGNARVYTTIPGSLGSSSI